jgi:cyclopropane fatty-acyl-phospholipid synthase-like methyltransferase
MGERHGPAEHIQQLIESHHPTAETLLELGCGTGSMLKLLSERYIVSGVDRSTEMVQIAMRKVPNAHYFVEDMTAFQTNQTFDVIICVFDSINHVIEFENWQRLFTNVKKHLNDGGLFVFDMNTQVKLARICAAPPLIQTFNGNYLIIDVNDVGDGVSNWNIKVFQHQGDQMFRLYEENIREVAFPADLVSTVLKSHFSTLLIVTDDGSPPSANTERLFFICQ